MLWVARGFRGIRSYRRPPKLNAWPTRPSPLQCLQAYIQQAGLSPNSSTDFEVTLQRLAADVPQQPISNASKVGALEDLSRRWTILQHHRGKLALTQSMAPILADLLIKNSPWPREASGYLHEAMFDALGHSLAFTLKNQSSTPHERDPLSEVAWAALASNEPSLVRALWNGVARARKGGKIGIPLHFLQALVAASAFSPTARLTSSILQLIRSVYLHTQHDMYLYSNKWPELLRESSPLDPKIKAKCRSWVIQCELAYVWNRGGNLAMNRRVKRWADKHDRQTLRRFWQAIASAADPRKGWVQIRWFDASADENEKEVGSETSEEEIAFTPELVSTFIISLLRLDMIALAADMWETLQQRKLKPTLGIWISLIAGHAYRRDPDTARAAYLQYCDSLDHDSPDPLAMVLVARALFSADRVDEGLEWVASIRATTKELPTQVANRLVASLLSKGLYDHAWDLVDSMPKSGPGCPNTATLNTLLSYTSTQDAEDSRFDLALTRMKGIQPDELTCRLVVRRMLDQGRLHDAQTFVQESGQIDSPDVKLLFAQYYLSIQPYSEENVDLAMALWGEIDDKHINEVHYADMIKNLGNQAATLYNDNLPDLAAEMLNKAYLIRDYAIQRRMRINFIAQNALMRAHFARGDDAGFRTALAIFADIRKQSAASVTQSPHPSSWLILLLGLEGRQDTKLAKEMVAQLEATGFKPTGALANIVYRLKKTGA